MGDGGMGRTKAWTETNLLTATSRWTFNVSQHPRYSNPHVKTLKLPVGVVVVVACLYVCVCVLVCVLKNGAGGEGSGGGSCFQFIA